VLASGMEHGAAESYDRLAALLEPQAGLPLEKYEGGTLCDPRLSQAVVRRGLLERFAER
jgi:hypothetical protein